MERTCETCQHGDRLAHDDPCRCCSVLVVNSRYAESAGCTATSDNWQPAVMTRVDESPTTHSAASLLNDASAIMTERGKQYDKPGGERSMAKTVEAFNAITGYTLSEADGWMFMAILKSVRLFSVRDKTHADSVQDLIAYTALLGESAMQKDNLK